MSRKVKILDLSSKMNTPHMRRASFSFKNKEIGDAILAKFDINDDQWYKVIQTFGKINEVIGVARGDNVASVILNRNDNIDLSLYNIEKIPSDCEIICGVCITKNSSLQVENLREGLINNTILESYLCSEFLLVKYSRNLTDYAYLKKFVQKSDGTSICIYLV